MTHLELRRIEPDGTRVYHGYNKYRPLEPHERTNGINKPDDPRAVRFHALWFLPLDLLPEDKRVMPETRSDEDAYTHMGDRRGRGSCVCDVCRRPPEIIGRWQRKWKSDQGLRAY